MLGFLAKHQHYSGTRHYHKIVRYACRARSPKVMFTALHWDLALRVPHYVGLPCQAIPALKWHSALPQDSAISSRTIPSKGISTALKGTALCWGAASVSRWYTRQALTVRVVREFSAGRSICIHQRLKGVARSSSRSLA